MKTMKKSAMSYMSVLCIIITLLLAGKPLPAHAATVYNDQAALAYAQSHWNDGKGLCAEFVSDCIKAGGSSCYYTGATTLRSQLISSGTGTGYELPLTSGRLKMSDYPGKISAGDPVFYLCSHHTTDNKPYIHVVLCAGADSNGWMKAYSHNRANSGSSYYQYNTKCYECGGPVTSVYVYHFNRANYQPGGIIEKCYSNGDGTVHVEGQVWAYTSSGTKIPTQCHIYFNNTDGYPATAGSDFRFSVDCPTSQRGNVRVDFNAIQVNGVGVNQLIESRTINIQNSSFSIGFDRSSIDLKTGSEVTLGITFKGEGIHHLNASLSQGIADMSWVSCDYSKGTASMKIKAAKAGTADLTISLINSSGGTLSSKKISLKFTTDAWVKLANSSISLVEGQMTLQPFTFGGSEAVYIDYELSGDGARFYKWGDFKTGEGEIYIQYGTPGKSAKLYIKVLDKDSKEIARACYNCSTSSLTRPVVTPEKTAVEVYKGESVQIKLKLTPNDARSIAAKAGNSSVVSTALSSYDLSTTTREVTLTVDGLQTGTSTVSITTKSGSYFDFGEAASITVKVVEKPVVQEKEDDNKPDSPTSQEGSSQTSQKEDSSSQQDQSSSNSQSGQSSEVYDTSGTGREDNSQYVYEQQDDSSAAKIQDKREVTEEEPDDEEDDTTPEPTSIRSLKAKKGKLTIKYQKPAENVSGVQIQICQKKNFKGKTKTSFYVKNTKGKAYQYTIKKALKKGKWFVRVRTYRTVDGERIYSSWSTKKHVRIR